MDDFRRDFCDLLVRFRAVRFGEFTLKSGRSSPYFVNAGQMRTGESMRGIGEAFATQIQASDVRCDLVFGPSYKGIPLAVSTAMALSTLRGSDVPYSFDRKEQKDHGEGGWFVGEQPADGMHIVVVDDVITSGRSIREAVDMLTKAADVTISAVVVAVDRMERGKTERSTLRELQDELGTRVLPIVNVRELIEGLSGREIDGEVVLDDTKRAAMVAYLAEYQGKE